MVAICSDCCRCVEGEDSFEKNAHGEDMCPHCGEVVYDYDEDAGSDR